NGDHSADVIVADRDGILIIFGKPSNFQPNDTRAAARDLGMVVHAVEPTLTIAPGHTDAYFKVHVPTEANKTTGDQVMDFSSSFADQVGAGLSMEILDANGRQLAIGDRIRIAAHQGDTLYVHVFGNVGSDGVVGQGAYTLV